MATMITERFSGNLIECSSNVDVTVGMLVAPTNLLEEMPRGTLGLKVKLQDNAELGRPWIVGLNILGNTGGKLADAPVYTAGSDLRVMAMLPGDIAYAKTASAIYAADPLMVDAGNPGNVILWTTGNHCIGYATENSADGFVRMVCA